MTAVHLWSWNKTAGLGQKVQNIGGRRMCKGSYTGYTHCLPGTVYKTYSRYSICCWLSSSSSSRKVMSRACIYVDCSLPASSVHGILQARILERFHFHPWGTFPTQGLNPHHLLHCKWILYWWATRKAQKSNNTTIKKEKKIYLGNEKKIFLKKAS